MTDKERKNFPASVINEVYDEQGGQCGKCGKTLVWGFHAHHKNGNSSDINKENCQLLCRSCHGGEQYKTLMEQKKASLTDLSSLIGKAVQGEIAGAGIEKTLDAIKYRERIQIQLADEGYLEPPMEKKLESYTTVMEARLEEYERGLKDGIRAGLSTINSVISREDEKLAKDKKEK